MTHTPPAKPKKPTRNNRITLRLFDDELAKLNAKSQEASLPIATYLRDRILELSPPIVRVRDLPTVNPSLMRQITGIGNNINQLTKVVHTELQTKNTPVLYKLSDQLKAIDDKLQQLIDLHSVK